MREMSPQQHLRVGKYIYYQLNCYFLSDGGKVKQRSEGREDQDRARKKRSPSRELSEENEEIEIEEGSFSTSYRKPKKAEEKLRPRFGGGIFGKRGLQEPS